MPFKSEKQRRYMHANLPDIAKRWERDYSNGGIAELNAELNSLPEYYMPFPAAQGGRIGFEKGLKVLPTIDITQTESTPAEGIDVSERDITYGLEGLLQGDNLYAGGEFQTGNVKVNVQEDGNTIFQDTMSKEELKKLYIGLGQKEGNRVEVGTDRKGNWTFNIVRSFNQGGLIPAHEAGIYGLAEGGRTGFRGGSPHDDSPTGPGTSSSGVGGGTSFSGGEGGHGDVAHGPGGRFNQPSAPTTPTEAPPGEKGGAGYISPADQRTLDIKEIISKQEEEKRDYIKKKSNPLWTALKWIGTGAAVIGSGGAALGLGGNKIVQTAQLINKVNKLSNAAVNGYNFINKTNFNKEELFNKIQNDAKIVKETDTAEQDLIQSLPKGHPERIQLEESVKMKTKTLPKQDEDHGPNIKIENIEEVNDAKTQLNQKYKEMNDASRLAWLRQQQMQEAKRQSYYQMMMKPYFTGAAQGGRVPQGYNTGGLSNLFRLKNV